MPERKVITIYDELFQKTWEKMVSIVGIHTVMVLVQRSLWQTRQTHPEAELITISEDGVSFEALEELDARQLKQMLEHFFTSLVDILARLVGEEITHKIAEGINVFKND